MARTKLAGQRSNLALLLSSIWAILGLFVIIVGHVVITFFVYGKFTDSDALLELAVDFPFLEVSPLYLTAGLAIVLDIWMLISQKRAYEKQFQR